jgi:hypothetical protein
VIAPPSVQNSTWVRRFGDPSDAFASGWMQLRGARRPARRRPRLRPQRPRRLARLQRAIAASGAERVIVTHGYEAVMVRWLEQQGLQAGSFNTEYGQDDDELPAARPRRSDASERAAAEVAEHVTDAEAAGVAIAADVGYGRRRSRSAATLARWIRMRPRRASAMRRCVRCGERPGASAARSMKRFARSSPSSTRAPRRSRRSMR